MEDRQRRIVGLPSLRCRHERRQWIVWKNILSRLWNMHGDLTA
jgi:hypothetical protein